MTAILIRTIPSRAANRTATPFRIVVPRQLEVDDAMAVYKALKANPEIKLHDPFFLADVSSIFPGVVYSTVPVFDLDAVRVILEELDAEYLADTFVELDVPESLEDQAEALDITDLTNPFDKQ